MVICKELLISQINNKNFYKRDNNLVPDLVQYVIKNNNLIEIKHCYGCPSLKNPRRRNQFAELIKNVLKKHKIKDGNVYINMADHPKMGVFNFCRIKNDNRCFLLPNQRFTYDDIKLFGSWKQENFPTFKETSDYLQNLHDKYKFEDKINKFYTSCIPHFSKVDYFKFALNNKTICDGYIYGGSVHKYVGLPQNFINACIDNGLAGTQLKDFVENYKYKYLIYNDGNTLSDRTRLLLNINSVIVKKQSPYEEFYSYLLKNNENYIEYSRTEELLDIYNRLENDNELCNKIINNNKNFINNVLNYNNLLEYTAYLLNNII